MALKALLAKNKRNSFQKQLDELRAKASEFESREKELEEAVNEMDDKTSEEDKNTVEKSVEEFEKEKEEYEKQIKELEEKIAEIDAEIEKLEKDQPKKEPTTTTTSGNEDEGAKAQEGRSLMANLQARSNFFGLTYAERDALFKREDVKTWVNNIRTVGKQKRAVTGADLTVPEVMLDLVHGETEKHSKLYKFVKVKKVKGTARQNILGEDPEGIWTEMVGKINELALVFTNVEVDGYKVAGFIPVPNSKLEDSDVALATEVVVSVGNALGKALDKAILYGKGKTSKMPTGIATAIEADTTLKTTHKFKISSTKDLALIRAVVENTGLIKHGEASFFWAMNKTTKAQLLAATLGANANAAVVAGMNNQMPVVGGEIVELNFMKDGDIIAGYGDCYLLVERAGIKVDYSDQVQFIEDNTVFRGRARYDGTPVFKDAFIVFNINNVDPTMTATFAADTANTPAEDEEESV